MRIKLTSIMVDNLTAEGVAFRREPSQAGPVTLAVFADTCGNLIQLYQPA
jgi:hypothetical protein